MLEANKRDILIHYDESTDEIIFYTVDSDKVDDIRNREFGGARTETAWFSEKEPDEAEQKLGGMVFSLLDTFSNKKIGIRDYQRLQDLAHDKYVESLELESSEGSAEAKYGLSVEYFHRARKTLDLALLEKAEGLLYESSKLGYGQAIKHLDKDWDTLKNATLRKIEREK